jgi:hypothetical protein
MYILEIYYILSAIFKFLIFNLKLHTYNDLDNPNTKNATLAPYIYILIPYCHSIEDYKKQPRVVTKKVVR